jgi:prolipoprotein diacylglyceryltransferase
MSEFYDKWYGLIPLLGGIYGLLLAYRVLPRNPKDPEKLELWHRKFDKIIKILCPIAIAFGLLCLFGVI